MNRKLIRTTLAEVKGKAREVSQPRERSNGGSQRGPSSDGGRDSGREAARAAQQSAVQCSMARKLRVQLSGMIAVL